MRTLCYSLAVLSTAAAAASAQSAQYSVDIAVSSAAFANGAVQAEITRKDPPGFALSPQLKVQVNVGVMGQKAFYSTTIVLKPGSSQSVSAPFTGSSSNVTFTVSANSLDMKEIASDDNTRNLTAGAAKVEKIVTPVTPVVMTMPVYSAKTAAAAPAPAPPPPPAPAPAPPPAPAAAPAPPAPAPPPAPPAPSGTIVPTSRMVLVGGSSIARPVGITGATLTTSSVILVGGAQGPTPVAPAGMTITTTPITLIGARSK